MNFIRGLFLVLIFFGLTFANIEQKPLLNTHLDNAVKITNKQDIIIDANKNKALALFKTQNENTQISSRRNSDNSPYTPETGFIVQKQNQNKVSYNSIKQSYKSSNGIALEFLLFNIQPNAP